jgi:Glycosyl hydrolase family 76
MTVSIDRQRIALPSRRPVRPRRTLGVALAAAASLALAFAPDAVARPSQYPAAAEHPLLVARAAQLARRATPQRARSAARSHRKPKHRKPPPPKLHGNAARALISFEAMQRRYYIGSGLYAGEPFSYLWPFSQALAATVTMANVKGTAKIPGLPSKLALEVHRRMVGLGAYLDTTNSGASEGTFTSTLAAFDGEVAPPVGPGGPKYYDDNDWIGIELARVYELTRKPAALGSAEAIMNFEMAGWSTEAQLACPGGIPFSNTVENGTRNTVTNAPAAELALQLFRITHKAQYLQFAQMAYEWVRTCLLAPNGLYADHIGRRGVVEDTFWSYNQGTMIGAGALLFQITGNRAYLEQARHTATAAAAYYTPQRLREEIPFFASVYFRNMLYLDWVAHESRATAPAQAYVDHAWGDLRLPGYLFVSGSPPSAQLLVQAAVVQIYALLSSPPSTYF